MKVEPANQPQVVSSLSASVNEETKLYFSVHLTSAPFYGSLISGMESEVHPPLAISLK